MQLREQPKLALGAIRHDEATQWFDQAAASIHLDDGPTAASEGLRPDQGPGLRLDQRLVGLYVQGDHQVGAVLDEQRKPMAGGDAIQRRRRDEPGAARARELGDAVQSSS